MSFSTERHRLQHENLMHKEMLKEAAMLLMDKILTSNKEEALNKKVLKTSFGKISYKEAKEKLNDKDSEDGKVVLKTLQNIVENYFIQYPDYGMEQMVRISEFKIK
jgi:Skp family chaperone for outer membrane proteins